MGKVEYKVAKLRMRGVFTKKDIAPDLERILNSEGEDGWKLVNSINQASAFGESERLFLVFMREVQ